MPEGTYYRRADLAKFSDIGKNRPELAKKFFDWYGQVFADGALSAREKSLIALAVAHTVQCPYCIDAYSKDCLEKGAKSGLTQRAWYEHDSNLDSLRKLPRFQALLDSMD